MHLGPALKYSVAACVLSHTPCTSWIIYKAMLLFQILSGAASHKKTSAQCAPPHSTPTRTTLPSTHHKAAMRWKLPRDFNFIGSHRNWTINMRLTVYCAGTHGHPELTAKTPPKAYFTHACGLTQINRHGANSYEWLPSRHAIECVITVNIL